MPTSLATHIADIYLAELDAVLSEGLGPAPLVQLLAPHIGLLARTRVPLVHSRLMSVLFMPVLKTLNPEEEEEERPTKRRKGPPPPEEPRFPAIAENVGEPAVVRAALLKAMFRAAAVEEAVESNRRKIYAVVRAEGDDDDDDE